MNLKQKYFPKIGNAYRNTFYLLHSMDEHYHMPKAGFWDEPKKPEAQMFGVPMTVVTTF